MKRESWPYLTVLPRLAIMSEAFGEVSPPNEAAPVAQWIEHRSSKSVVVSSSLTGRAIVHPPLSTLHLFSDQGAASLKERLLCLSADAGQANSFSIKLKNSSSSKGFLKPMMLRLFKSLKGKRALIMMAGMVLT